MKNRTLLLILACVVAAAALGSFFLWSDTQPAVRYPIKQSQQIDSVEALKHFIEEGQREGYFPNKVVRADAISTPRLETIALDFRTLIHWDEDARCPAHEDEIILALSDDDHSVTCATGDTLILMGKGNDWLDDITGNDIVLAGEGDDILDSGTGSDIFIFEPNWGHDTLTVNTQRFTREHLTGYPYPYDSFFIFSKGLARNDFVWEGNTLLHAPTGSSITVNTRNVNILFADDPRPTPCGQDIPQQQPAQEIALDDFWAESVTVDGDLGYYARGTQGLFIVDLTQADAPLLLSQMELPGRAMTVQLAGDIAFVAQGDPYLEGKKGWVSLIDISNPRQPRHLKDLAFGNNIFNVAVDREHLYVSDIHFFKKRGQLHLYDISTPASPELISSTLIPHYAKFIACLDQRVYLSDFNRGVTVFDVSKASAPRLVKRCKLFKKSAWSIKVAGDKLVVNQSDDRFSVLKPHRSKGVKKICDVLTTDQADVGGLADYDSLVVKGEYLFRAEGFEGVTIHRLSKKGKARLVRRIDSNQRFITTLYVVRDQLIAFDGKKHASIHSLADLFPQPEAPRSDAGLENASPINEEALAAKRERSPEQLQTLLYKAAVNNDPEQIEALCTAGANPNHPGHERYTPLETSALLGNMDALDMLLRQGGDPNRKQGTAMTLAALAEHFDAMKLLADYGGEIGQADTDGCTTLHYLAQDGTLEMVRYLVEQGVPVNAGCRGGQTALDWAHFDDNKAVIAYLETVAATTTPSGE
ncbi:ankyrin repeat domain-containing protein [Desulfoluna sp.]|uniref:ankyrin repeat domain-containing protein n=1 Tax=Desulfoluna sp. TaxID=2045199 RepID=UPI002614A14E|nr:ankyrin repeat domain-containing protein [Desulfoluna sp.]